MEPHWEFVLRHEKALRSLCRRMCRQRHDLVEDLFSDCVVARAADIMKTYDPEHESGASLKHHMFVNMRLYMWKWMNRMGRKYAERHNMNMGDDFDVGRSEQDQLELKDWVTTIVEQLSEYDAYVLSRHVVDGLTFKQIADEVGGISKSTARKDYLEAISRARSVET